MRKCTICGTKLLPNETICPNCGNQYKTSQKEKKKLVKSIDWKFVFRALGRVLLAFIIVYDVYSWVSRPQTTPQDYFENQYGENYDLIEYKDYDSFKKDYPELSGQIQPYYQLVKERHTYEKNPENVYPTLNQEWITVVNGQIHSVGFNLYIYNEQKDIGVNYSLDRVSEDMWNEMILADVYNVNKEEFIGEVQSHLYYIEEILEIDLETEILDISDKITNYYKAVKYVSNVDDFEFKFNYNGNGDFKITLHNTIYSE